MENYANVEQKKTKKVKTKARTKTLQRVGIAIVVAFAIYGAFCTYLHVKNITKLGFDLVQGKAIVVYPLEATTSGAVQDTPVAVATPAAVPNENLQLHGDFIY